MPKRKAATRHPKKEAVVRMRISESDKATLEAAASRDALQLSQWLRRVALKAAGALPDSK